MSGAVWLQWTLIGLMAISLMTDIGKDGEPRKPWNAGFAIADFMIVFFLLWQGGFFRALGWQP